MHYITQHYRTLATILQMENRTAHATENNQSEHWAHLNLICTKKIAAYLMKKATKICVYVLVLVFEKMWQEQQMIEKRGVIMNCHNQSCPKAFPQTSLSNHSRQQATLQHTFCFFSSDLSQRMDGTAHTVTVSNRMTRTARPAKTQKYVPGST